MSKLIEQLKRHEGFRSKMYRCTENKRTIGYGYNLDANSLGLSEKKINRLINSGISENEAKELLTEQVSHIMFYLSAKLLWWSKLTEPRQAVLINMAFNMGINGLFGFGKTLPHIERGDYKKAADEMLDSDWARKAKSRSLELSKQMATGKY